MSHRAATAACLLLACSGCLSRRVVAEGAGDYGWFQVDAHGPPAADQVVLDRLEPVALGLTTPGCDVLQQKVSSTSLAPLLVMVHGIGAGDGPEWDNVISILMNASPAGAFLFKWVAYEDRDQLVQRLAMGISRLAQCTQHPIVVLAHSAGGVLSSYAAGQIALPPGVPVELVTVASPLAGNRARSPSDSGGAEVMYLFDLGTRIARYPPSAQGVRVWHLRTRYPADTVMKPGTDGISANDITVGVPGAKQYTLPAPLSHVAALTWVARRMSHEGWLAWLFAAQPEPPEFELR